MRGVDTPEVRLAQRRLWQLISPALPVGAYSFSAGLEAAVEAGWLSDRAAVQDWLQAQMLHAQAYLDLPVLIRLYRAWMTHDGEGLEYWNAALRAGRETRELRLEDAAMGRALARLLSELGVAEARSWAQRPDTAWATGFALGAVSWSIPLPMTLDGFLWAWCENQVAAAIKLVPLGQTDGQRLLLAVADTIPAAVDRAWIVEDADLGAGLPGVALASAWHETQYSRLFRS